MNITKYFSGTIGVTHAYAYAVELTEKQYYEWLEYHEADLNAFTLRAVDRDGAVSVRIEAYIDTTKNAIHICYKFVAPTAEVLTAYISEKFKGLPV